MNIQKLKIILKYNTFKDFSIFENLFSLFFFFKNNFKQLVFNLKIKKKYKKLIILRAPFVNKKSRNQLGFLFYQGQLILNFQYKSIDFCFLNQLNTFIKKQIFQNKIFFKLTIIKVGFLF